MAEEDSKPKSSHERTPSVVPAGAESLMGLFAAPKPPRPTPPRQTPPTALSRKQINYDNDSFRLMNPRASYGTHSRIHSEMTAVMGNHLMTEPPSPRYHITSDDDSSISSYNDGSIFIRDSSSFEKDESITGSCIVEETTPLTDSNKSGILQTASKSKKGIPRRVSYSSLKDQDGKKSNQQKKQKSDKGKDWRDVIRWNGDWTKTISAESISSTVIGSGTFVLYHIVFCLALASAITRPHSPERSILGPIAKTAALGVMSSGPLFITAVGSEVPALYPCVDLFLAPFLANLAVQVDDSLYAQNLGGEKHDELFLATFTILSSIGMLLSGILCVFASKFKLANLGAYLPYPVLCGFFSAVAVMLWMLAFSVDMNGQTFPDVIKSGDSSLMWQGLLHHSPSLIIGIIMKILGPKKPYYITTILLMTIGLTYGLLYSTGTTLQEAQELNWFWTEEELSKSINQRGDLGFEHWAPPAPFGYLNAILTGQVNVPAIISGLPTVVALAFLYLLRCSLHAAALRKNIPNVTRAPKDLSKQSNSFQPNFLEPGGVPMAVIPAPPRKIWGHTRGESTASFQYHPLEPVPIPAIIPSEKNEKPPRKTQISMLKILMWYGNSLICSALVGGFGNVPSIAASKTLFDLGAERRAPQYGSLLLLAFFYLTNFRFVTYIPKPAFSSLLVLASLDIIITWFFKSFSKTKQKGEWMVVPIIVVAAFAVGMLMSVALGIACSTFIFVGAFYRTGVVKFVANGLTVRSTIERNVRDGSWLDNNGDLIQILVLQNYLFFGNASSCLTYITTMFEETPEEDFDFPLPPIPKFLILDLTIVSGMDTSAVDVFAEIIAICKVNQCVVFMAGLSLNLKSILYHGGVKQDFGRTRYFPDLESALGKAEDSLLVSIAKLEEHDLHEASIRTRKRLMTEDDTGFLHALRQIDEQHEVEFADGLAALQKLTTVVELAKDDVLFDNVENEADRGLFFIEHGVMKVERDSSYSMTRGSTSSLKRKIVFNDGGSISQWKARTGTIGREGALQKGVSGQLNRSGHNFRLGRIGPGWVVGTIEGCTGMPNSGVHIAITACRLHHIPYKVIREVETKDPALILHLYKMLSHLMARRQQGTIDQISQLHSIMTSPAPTKPVSRATMAALQNAMKYH